MADDTLPPVTDDAHLNLARETLEALLEKMQITATVTAAWREPEEDGDAQAIGLDVQGNDLSPLIGRKGETLAALQYITRLIIAKHLKANPSVVIDVEGFKKRRDEQLRRMARRAAEQAVERNKTITLEPMPAHERRVVHLELRAHEQVFTESVGEGDRRKVTVIPK